MFSAPANRLTFQIEQKTHLLARHGKQIAWRWRSQKPLHLLGVNQRVLVVWERLKARSTSTDGNTDRFTGLEATTGRRLWQTVLHNLDDAPGERYGRVLFLYQPNGVFASGNNLLLDMQTGRLAESSDGGLEKKTPQELLWIRLPGPPPYGDWDLYLLRINPQTLQTQKLFLPVAQVPGLTHDGAEMFPVKSVRVTGDTIEALYTGSYKSSTPPPREEVFFIARYRWSAGPKQKPDIQLLKEAEWPK